MTTVKTRKKRAKICSLGASLALLAPVQLEKKHSYNSVWISGNARATVKMPNNCRQSPAVHTLSPLLAQITNMKNHPSTQFKLLSNFTSYNFTLASTDESGVLWHRRRRNSSFLQRLLIFFPLLFQIQTLCPLSHGGRQAQDSNSRLVASLVMRRRRRPILSSTAE